MKIERVKAPGNDATTDRQSVQLQGTIERGHGKGTRGLFFATSEGTFPVKAVTEQAKNELIKVGWPNNSFDASLSGDLVTGAGGSFLEVSEVKLASQSTSWTPKAAVNNVREADTNDGFVRGTNGRKLTRL